MAAAKIRLLVSAETVSATADPFSTREMVAGASPRWSANFLRLKVSVEGVPLDSILGMGGSVSYPARKGKGSFVKKNGKSYGQGWANRFP